MELSQLLFDLPDLLLQTGSFLCLELFPQLLIIWLELLLKLTDTLRRPAIRQHHLACRIDLDLLHLFDRPLAFHIKASDGIDLRIPHIDTIWTFLCQRENINDTTTHKEYSYFIG